MSKFEEFREAFELEYDDIYDFIRIVNREEELPFGGKLEENNDMELFDSYGAEDSILERIVYFGEYDIFVKFDGTRSSYNGEDWTTFREVKKVEKTITVFE